MQQITAAYDSFCEKDNRLSQAFCYFFSGSILTYAYIRHRPFTKFIKPRSIPEIFIKDNKVLQKALVVKVQPTIDNGAIIYLNHKPPISFLSYFSQKTLPIKIAGVQINGNGCSWLRQMLPIGSAVEFIPFNNKGNECYAKVFLKRENKSDLDLAMALVSLGFGRVSIPDIESTVAKSNFAIYQKKLKKSESRAKLLRKGLWANAHEKNIVWFIRLIEKMLFNLKPHQIKIPAIVR